jgi:hypothetical protein
LTAGEVVNRLATFNSTSVTIDADGNLTYGPETNNTFGTYSYDPRNELTNAGGLSYGYDPAGNRTTMNNGTNVTTYVIDPKTSQVLMRIKGGITNYYVYSGGLLYESDETSSTTNTAFYHYDCRGSAITLTDSNGEPKRLSAMKKPTNFSRAIIVIRSSCPPRFKFHSFDLIQVGRGWSRTGESRRSPA